MACTIYDKIIKKIKYNFTFRFWRDFAVISKVASLGDITGYSLQLAKDEGTTRG